MATCEVLQMAKKAKNQFVLFWLSSHEGDTPAPVAWQEGRHAGSLVKRDFYIFVC